MPHRRDPETGLCRRGTSNRNQRGSAEARRRRKHYLLVTFKSNLGSGITRCYRCRTPLDYFTVTVDRIIPGCEGGTYRRENIRPACAGCNSETGGALASKPNPRKITMKKVTMKKIATVSPTAALERAAV